MRQALARYRWAILFKRDVEPAAPHVLKPDKRAGLPPSTFHNGTYDVVGNLEALAFNDGYYLALGFSGGSCKAAFCRNLPCQALQGGGCRFPLRGRPSMEGVGIDVFDLANKVGWPVYPIAHKDVDPASIGCAISVGIVFVH